MGSFNFNSYRNIDTPVSKSDYTYIDLWFDIERNVSYINSTNYINKIDIRAAYDEEAIRNSIVNIFKTIPGERPLVPLFGSNLLAYVFQPVSEEVGNQIGESILSSIRKREPRVTVKNITVVGKPDDHEYKITITISIPSLKKSNIRILGVLSQEGFIENRG